MNLDYMIVSNFLDNPDKVRQSLIDQDLQFNVEGYFPGKRSCIPNEEYMKMIDEKLEKVLPFKFKHNMNTSSYSFQLCLEGQESWIHKDQSDWAGVLYLTPNAPMDSGTVIYSEKPNNNLRKSTERDKGEEMMESGTYVYQSPDESEIEPHLEGMEQEHDLISVVGNVYNTLLLIRGNAIPHKSNLAGFGDCLENGRLTQVFFFDIVK